MTHELVIKDHRGTTGIVVKLWAGSAFIETDKNGNEYRYDVRVWNTPKRKRNQIYQNLDFVTYQEIYAAKMELWNKLKP